MSNRQVRLLAWLFFALVLGLALGLGGYAYQRLTDHVEQLNFKLTADRFQTAVSAVRAHYYIDGSTSEGVDLYRDLPGLTGNSPATKDNDMRRVYLNNAGWPAHTRSRAAAEDELVTADVCQQLWHALLSQAPPTTTRDSKTVDADYRVLVTPEQACRYERSKRGWDGYIIDYAPSTGAVVMHQGGE